MSLSYYTAQNASTMSSNPPPHESTPPHGGKPLIVADPHKGVKVNASVVANPFREEIKKKVRKLKEQKIGE